MALTIVYLVCFLWLSTIIGWIVFNLYQKNVKLEAMVIRQANFVAELRGLIKHSEKAIKALDEKIWLESDKELQEVYYNLRAVQEGLDQFSKE